MDKIADLIIKYRILFLVIILFGTLFFGYQLPNLEFDFSVESMMLENDPDVELIKNTFDQFGSDEISFVAITMPADTDVFTPKNIKIIDRLTKEIENLDRVDEVTSIANIKVIDPTPEGFTVRPLITQLPTNEAQSEKLRRRALDDHLIVGTVTNPQGDAILIMVRYDYMPEDFNARVKAVKQLRERIRQIIPDTMEWHIAGLPTGAQIMNDLGILNAKIFTPITMLVIAFFLVYLFRSTYGLILPQLTVLVGATWTVGLMVLCGQKFNMATTMIPSLIIAYSFSDVIHLFTHYFHDINDGKNKNEAIKQMIVRLFLPCLLSSVTTAVGFSSLTVSKLEPIKVFGIFSAIGVILVFLISITLVPALLYYTKPPSRKFLRQHTAGKTFRLLAAIAELVGRRPKSVLAVSAVLLVIGLFGILRLKVETNLIEFFKKDNEIVIAKDFVQEHLTGTTPIDIIIELPQKGSFKDPENLRQLDETAAYLKTLPQVRNVNTLADLIKEINKVMNEGDPEYYRIPDSRDLIAQYLLLYSFAGEDELSRLIDFGYRTSRIVVRCNYMISAEMKQVINNMNGYLQEHYEPPIVARVTGTGSLFIKMVDYLIESQAKSLALAFVMILITMTVLFRSLRLGLLSMIPNFFPILMILGVMGWLGIDLDVVTAMVASVALGIAVDDTIHFLVRFEHELEHNDDYKVVMVNTLTTTGKAMTFTTITICSGFAVLMLSLINPPAYFGLLTCISLIFALLADLFVMPALMVLLHPKMKILIDRSKNEMPPTDNDDS
jgi:uncharacterized protein